MSNKKSQKTTEVWGEISQGYSKLVIPNRPSSDDCANYGALIHSALKKTKKPKIMVMGSTPELRSILYTYTFRQGAQIFTTDISSDMNQAMREFMVPSTIAELKEKFFCGSWLKTNFPNNFFDLVVGDEVICNIPADQHPFLFSEINRILKKKAHWITRHNFYLAKNKKQSSKDIILGIVNGINQGQYTFQYGVNILYLLLFYRLIINQPQHQVNLNDEIKVAKNVLAEPMAKEQQQTLKELIRLFERYFGKYKDYYWYVLSRPDSLNELKTYFNFKKELYAKDYLTARHSPVWLLQKRAF